MNSLTIAPSITVLPDIETRRNSTAWLTSKAEALGIPLFLVDSQTGELMDQSHAQGIPLLPLELQLSLGTLRKLRFYPIGSDLLLFALPLESQSGVIVGYSRTTVEKIPACLTIEATNLGWSAADLNAWLEQIPVADQKTLSALFRLADLDSHEEKVAVRHQATIRHLTEQIEQTHETINILHDMTRLPDRAHSPTELIELCLEGLQENLPLEGHLICIDDTVSQESKCLMGGAVPLNSTSFQRLLDRLQAPKGNRSLFKSGVARSLLGADFPGLRDVALIPIISNGRRCGWLFSCNLISDQEFSSSHANLLTSVAEILGTHLRNFELYDEQEELLISFVRSLVSTLDAKDPYTRGHSERVALIARRLGEELQLPQGDLEAIYLSGLLHDLGKIGVDDSILSKPGKLTEDEFRQIQRHPVLGFEILKQLKNLHHVLPGVRNHHESVNGSGYPDRLVGEEIPLMARILAVADAYDAMLSDRPYRKGMPLEKLEEIFRQGAGIQWDSRIIEAYFSARIPILQLCLNYGELDQELFPEESSMGSDSLISRTLRRSQN